MSLFVSNAIDFTTYQSMVRLSNERRNELEARLNLLQIKDEQRTARYSKADIVTNLQANWNALDNEQRLQFVQRFIKKIIVYNHAENGEVHGNVVIDEVLFNEG